MKTQTLGKFIFLFFLLPSIGFTQAIETNSFDTLLAQCVTNDGGSHCWDGAERAFNAQPQPQGTRELDTRFLQSYVLAKTAFWVGDDADALRLYKKTETLISQLVAMQRNQVSANPEMNLLYMIKYDLGLINLSLKSYENALMLFVESEHLAISFLSDDFQKFTQIGQLAALIGLQRQAEIELKLSQVLGSLNYNEIAPWEASPIEPQIIGPFSTARRIAAAYLAHRQYTKALDVITHLEQERNRILAEEKLLTNEMVRGQKWAAKLTEFALKNDRAEILIRQNRFTQAEKILLEILTNPGDIPPAEANRSFSKLARINDIKGNKEKAKEFKNKVHTQRKNYANFDPFSQSFGLIP